MTDHTRPDDAAQADALDRYLDALAHGERPTTADLDPTLAATVRRAHALGDEGVLATTRRAGKVRRWETIMRDLTHSGSPRPRKSASPTVRVLPSLGPVADERGPWPREQHRELEWRSGLLRRTAASPVNRRPPRTRRIPGGPIGLVATLALVVVIAAASLAVMLTAPEGGGEPTMLPAAFGATPAATLPAAEHAPGSPRLISQLCVAPERPFDDVMSVLAQRQIPQTPMFQVDAASLTFPLPDGLSPDPALVGRLESLYVQYRACAQHPLRLASISTSAGIVRFFTSDFPAASDLVSGDLIVRAWRSQGEAISDDSGIGSQDLLVLLDLRYLPDGRVAGYLAQGFSQAADGTVSLTGGAQSYIVFAQEGGLWLLDDYQPMRQG